MLAMGQRKKKRGHVVPALTLDARLKRKVRDQLRELGFTRREGELVSPASTKDSIRALHAVQRRELLAREKAFIASALGRLEGYFADGNEVDVRRLSPRLELIESGTWQADLFRLASLSWSVPVSRGFGRRLRYLVWDDACNKLIGLFALGDPVFNMRARDEFVGWNIADRSARLVNVMDAYVLGAVPPYNKLLGGKLVASLIRTTKVRDDFRKRYGAARGIISGRLKRARLAIVTTTSSLGRSSIYNRLRLAGQDYFSPLGFTGGWGHFHIRDSLFEDLRTFLRRRGHLYVDGHQFGDGPSWRLRTIREALKELGFQGDMLRHGVGREVFAAELASNARDVLTGKARRPLYSNLLSVAQVSALAKERWIIPRAEREPDFKLWKRQMFVDLLNGHAASLSANQVRRR